MAIAGSSAAKLASRLLWHANRSPAAGAIKWGLRTLHRKEVAERRALARALSLAPNIDSLAASLNTDGFAVLTDLVDPGLCATIVESGNEKLSRAEQLRHLQATSHKSFWIRLLDEDVVDGQLPSDNAFVRFATQPAVVHLLARALGEVPQLSDVLLTLSEESNKQLAYSQLWHRDFDDIRTLKLFAYLTDVPTTDFGPFTFLPGETSDRFGRSLHSHMEDEQVFRTTARDSVREIKGPRATVFLVETSRCLHMGSRMAPGHHRLLYTATFVTAPRPYFEPPPRFSRRGTLDVVTEAVLFRARDYAR
jgi:hypothetical protein